jgi:TatD DNase family protein
MHLIDIGPNLTHRSFETDREAVIARALAAGVSQMILTGTALHSSRRAQELAASHPDVLFSTAGVHPHDTSRCDKQTLQAIEALLQLPEVVAVGECGLDFNRDFSPRNIQLRWFEAQIDLAVATGKPLFLHERDAHAAFLDCLDAYTDRLPPAIVHCFTGDARALAAYLDRGFFIGITGWICDERRGRPLQNLVKKIPLNRIMIETDSPFLIPRDLSPKPTETRNEPAFLPHIAKTLAHHMNLSPEDIATATTQNARQFFNLPPAPVPAPTPATAPAPAPAPPKQPTKKSTKKPTKQP